MSWRHSKMSKKLETVKLLAKKEIKITESKTEGVMRKLSVKDGVQAE